MLYKNSFYLYIKRARLIYHSKTGQKRPVFEQFISLDHLIYNFSSLYIKQSGLMVPFENRVSMNLVFEWSDFGSLQYRTFEYRNHLNSGQVLVQLTDHTLKLLY